MGVFWPDYLVLFSDYDDSSIIVVYVWRDTDQQAIQWRKSICSDFPSDARKLPYAPYLAVNLIDILL